MAETFRPTDAAGVLDAVAWAVAEETPLEIIGAGSKRGLGRPLETAYGLDLSGLAGIALYEPAELVMTALAGTPLTRIEAALAEAGQQLAFEPPDLGPLFGGPAGRGTIGGVIACNLSGPRRMKAGAARDHFLGVETVTGRGESIAAGGRVVKNVTGYDLCKLIAGSYGTLAVMTKLTFKVMPAPEKTRTVLVFGLDCAAANRAMTDALTSSMDVSGAAHLQAAAASRVAVDYVSGAGTAVTALRIEGPAPSVEQRCRALRALMASCGEIEELHGHNSTILWRAVGDGTALMGPPGRLIWRLSIPPASGAAVAARITEGIDADAVFDWAGGLIWLSLEGGREERLRDAVVAVGGHATLMAAPKDDRRRIPVFEPQPAGLRTLTARIKDSFDPKRILNPGRMYDGV